MTHIQTKTIIDLFFALEQNIRSATIVASLAVVADMGQATIVEVSERLNICHKTTFKCLATLVRTGFLTVEKNTRGSHGRQKNIYRIKA